MTDRAFVDTLSRTVAGSVAMMSGLSATEFQMDDRIPDHPTWSWVKVIDPRPGTLVVGMEAGLAQVFAAVCFCKDVAVVGDHEIKDAQAEFTNVLAGRLAQERLQNVGVVGLGVPRTGRGMPDVRNGAWVGRHFKIEGRILSVFVTGPALTGASPPVGGISTVIITDATPDQQFIPVQSSLAPGTPGDIPLRIGHYHIIDQLGAGGMGVVYKAHHDTLNRLVALKVMRPDLAQDQEFIARFLREGRATATIDHSNVVPVYDAGFEDGQLYLAMRFVPGGDLATLLHRSGVLPEARALVITQGCLDGVQAIQDGGLIHRDIKPANILLENNGVPRLADLGLARLAISLENSQPGAPQGTPAFMSPEQARAQRNLDIRCDLYSIGVTMFCMLTGDVPFKGDSPYDIAAKVLYDLAPDVRQYQPRISAETAAMVKKAMAKDPNDRFQSPAEFQQAVTTQLMHLANVKGKTTSGLIEIAGTNNYWMRKLFGK